MIKLEVCIFGLCLKLDLHIHRVPKNVDKCPKPEERVEREETPIYQDEIDYLFDESKITQIAEQFQKDLNKTGIYDIPSASDIPPRVNIQDDVEIITDDFEIEIERIREGVR